MDPPICHNRGICKYSTSHSLGDLIYSPKNNIEFTTDVNFADIEEYTHPNPFLPLFFIGLFFLLILFGLYIFYKIYSFYRSSRINTVSLSFIV